MPQGLQAMLSVVRKLLPVSLPHSCLLQLPRDAAPTMQQTTSLLPSYWGPQHSPNISLKESLGRKAKNAHFVEWGVLKLI